jgi:uncharacterized protein (TIGR00290 family)
LRPRGLNAPTEPASVGPVEQVVLSWSGGKDSALALWALRHEYGVEPVALLTTVTEQYARVSMHGVRRELLQAQAEAVGIPLLEVAIPPRCPNQLYEQRMAQALASAELAPAQAVAFGDLFLEDIRNYREERLAQTGKRALFPLWGRDTAALAHSFVELGFEALLVCVWTRASSTARSPGAASTPSCWRRCRRASIHAGRTASSTPSSTPARSSGGRSAATPGR